VNMKLKMIVAIVILTVLYLIGSFFFTPPIEVESSDGKWGDRESLLKGRDFEETVYYFEKYRLRCNVPEVTMVRTTPKNLLNIFGWPSYLFNDKWKLEYREHPTDFSKGYYAKIKDCYDKRSEIANEEWRIYQARNEFLKNLANAKRPSLFKP
jgi:hypothetical protein